MNEPCEVLPHERRWGMLAHLLTFAGAVLPLGNLIVPLGIGFLRRDSAFVRFHARSAFRFQVSIMAYEALAVALALLATGAIRNGMLEQSAVTVAVVTSVALYGLAVLIGWVALVVHASIRAQAGHWYRYPFLLWFFK